jgi:hypothetical protein
MEIMRATKKGKSVCIFAEGVRTWDGVTNPILPSTASLIKAAKCGLVTYRVTGGYFVSPNWSEGGTRRGPISGAPILLISIIAPCVILPLQLRALPSTPDRPAIKREMLISGIRNPILNVIAWITIGSGLTYGYYEGADGTSGSYHIWHEENIFIGVAVILLVILAAELIRRWLRKKSA